MRRVVIVSLVVLMVSCVGLVGGAMIFGRPILNRLFEKSRENVAEVMQDSLYQSSVEAIGAGNDGQGDVRLHDRDLSVNNTAVVGEAGWETGTSGTVVYGFDLLITTTNLSLGIEGKPMLSGVPVIVDGRLELTDVEVIDDSSFAVILNQEDFEQVVEGGLNDALAAHDLTPTGLSLRDGVMIIEVGGGPESTPMAISLGYR